MGNPFDTISPSTAFLTGLATSTMNAFKDEHERQQKEDKERKDFDYKILMKAMDDPNLTPSQAREILTRAVDIYKPKGHGGIKDRLGEVFGKGKPYESQAGNIINDVTSKPRANVAAPTQTATPGGEGAQQVRARTVTLPPPPQSAPEQTYREQDLADKERLIEAQTTKALAVEEARNLHRKQEREAQNAAMIDRFTKENQIKDKSKAESKLRERAAILNPSDPDDPTAIGRAAIQLQGEIADKKKEAASKLQMNAERMKKIDSDISISQQRISIAKQRLSISRQSAFDKDPQVKGSYVKVHEYINLAKTARTQAAILWGKNAKDPDDALVSQAQELEKQAEGDEQKAQQILEAVQNRVNEISGVKLPAPPTAGAKRGAVKLTRAEILGAGGTEADVADAKRRGVLAQ